MEKIHFSTTINAPKERVWNTMLGEDTYREWTDVFMPGSHFKGSWEKGSKILFLAPGESGKTSGMVSRIKENRKHEYISIEHLGFVENGKEDATSEAVKSWAGALENYTFTENDDKTEVMVEMDTSEEYKEMFLETWPKALQKLKKLSEEGQSQEKT
ncbi:hypothetical protein BH23BAC3_BH23BAC3_31550 [soil metagenome]